MKELTHIPGVPDVLRTLPGSAAALLVEYQGNTQEELDAKIERFIAVSPDLTMLNSPVFSTNPIEQAFLWKIRKGMFPAVGAVRASGSTVILEDIAFPVGQLGDAILDLHKLFEIHGSFILTEATLHTFIYLLLHPWQLLKILYVGVLLRTIVFIKGI